MTSCSLADLQKPPTPHVQRGKTRVETLCLLVPGMISARAVNLTHSASERPARAKIASACRRLQRIFQPVLLPDDPSVGIVMALIGNPAPALPRDRPLQVGRYAHARQFKRMRKALKKLKSHTGRLRSGTRTNGVPLLSAQPAPPSAGYPGGCLAGPDHRQVRPGLAPAAPAAKRGRQYPRPA